MTSSDAGVTSSSINSPIAPSPMPTLSPAPSLTLSPVSTTSGNLIHRPFAGGLLRRGGPLSTHPERPSGRLRRTAPGRAAGRDVTDRGHGQLPGEPSHGKAQQMRWTRRGADLLLQVRCALYNGTLGTGFGQKFLP